MSPPLLLALVAVALVLTSFVGLARRIRLASPSELLVISGSRRTVGDRTLGYRLLRGGRAIPLPWLERTDRLDLTVLPVTVVRRDLLAKDLTSLRVEVAVMLRVAGTAPAADAAAACLLGRSRGEVEELARAMLEGTLAHVVAACAPELLHNDPAHFENVMIEEAEPPLQQVGLVIDRLALRLVEPA